uniref:Uncharacterized protein n=1 Tax=Caenorhabditis japonica TaxID=281687 RepID=A0A8R1IAM2_CAEJA
MDRMDEQTSQCTKCYILLSLNEKSEKNKDFKDLCLKSRHTQRANIIPIGYALAYGLDGGTFFSKQN